MASIRSVLARLSTRGRIALAGAAVAIVVLLFVMFQMATSQSYTTLASGVDPAETGQITGVLEDKGIPFEVRGDGTTVAVADSDVSQARIALAESDVVGGNKPGFELFDKQQFGASDFQQKVTYQRALEGELQRTISQVEGVSDVTVQLTLPEDQLFAAEAVKPTAAVLIGTSSGRLGAGAVRGVANLVAASVEGLSTKDVTITDASGATLWPAGAGGAGAAGGLSKQAVEARYEQGLEARLDALLLRTIGPEKGRVQVQADIDADRTTQSKLEYADKGTPLDRSTENETLAGAGAGVAGGAAGAAGNIPSYGAGAAPGGGNSNYKRKTEEAQYGVDKTVTHTQVAPGSVNRQDVALVVDKSVPPAELKQLETAIASAAGIEPKRGDTISTSRIAFAKPPAPAEPSPVGGIVDAGKYVLLGLAALAFLFFAGRHLRRRQDEVLDAEPVWLRELNAPTSLAELELAERDRWEEDTAVHHDGDEVASMEPDRVAQQLRAWMKEG
ncbi:MAG TPA: flagellar basal-body MS-ring/collar protein FliF [Solirubrobacterales bacterium]|nr:flagellar basal-body MS-ring/collar protein FliF [Solirubrobacterales bacterium]